MNRNLLSHPEFYTESCYYDSQALRRYRLCPDCLDGGMLVLAVHDGKLGSLLPIMLYGLMLSGVPGACKMWPGGGPSRATHEHCFCFKCTGR